MTTTVRFLGHAAIEVRTAGQLLLVDPYLKGNPMAAITPESAKPDFILVSHGHSDHIGDTVSIARRSGATVISNAEIAGWLSKQGIKTHAQHIGGGFHYPFGYLKLTHAEHGSGLPDGSYGGNPCGFLLVTTDNQKIYLAGDTGLFGDMKLIGEEGIDLAFLPIGDNYTMGPEDALRAVKLMGPKMAMPIHYNTFDLIRQDPHQWAERVQAETSTRVKVLQPGESIEIP